MSTKSYLLGSVEFSLDQLKSVSQFYETVKTYNASRELVPKKGEDGKELKKLKLNFPDTYIHMLTNGRLYAYDDLVRSIADINHPRFVSAIPLYSEPDLYHA